MATIAAIYTRVSVKDDTSNARQREACKAFCKAKGWKVGPLFQEHGITGTGRKDRPEWRKLRAVVDAKQVGGVVVFAISRAARNVEDLLAFGRKCDELGIAFESVSEPIGGQYGRVFLALLGAIAELESKAKADRALLKRQQMTADQLWPGGPRPFGLDVIYTDDPASKTRDARLVINEAESALIRQAARDIIRGQPLGMIMRRWNDGGVTTSLGKQWRRTSLRQLFLRPSLSAQPAILTKRDADAVRAVLEDPARHHPRRIERYLLTGILICSKCGKTMQGYPGHGRRYICRSDGHVHRTIQADQVEQYVMDAVKAHGAAKLAEVGDPAGVQGPILAQLDEIDARLDAFAENAALAGMPASAIRSGTKALLRERERLEKELEAATPPPPPTTFGEQFSAEEARLRAEIEATTRRVVIRPPTKPFNVFNPKRVQIAWRR